MKKNSILLSGLIILTFCLNACMSSKQATIDEKLVEPSYATKLGLAPAYSSITITEHTPYGANITYQVGENYNSALGQICKKAFVVEKPILFIVVCESEKNTQEVPDWEVTPLLR